MTVTQFALVGVLGLLGTGLYGLLASRNLIKIVIALQIVGKAAVLALVAAGAARGQPDLGQSIAVTVIVADTVAAVLGLALSVQLQRITGSLNAPASMRR
jgi:NADH-quinone oxidoreductase subunit K